MLEQAIKQQTEEVARLGKLEQAARVKSPHCRYETPEHREKHEKACDDYYTAAYKLYKMKEEFNQIQSKIETRDRCIALGLLAGITASMLIPGIVDHVKEAKKTHLKLKPTPIKQVPAVENEVQIDDGTTTINDVTFTNDREM